MSEHNNNRAEVDTTAREELVNKIVAEINRRCQNGLAPETKKAIDDMIQAKKSSSGR